MYKICTVYVTYCSFVDLSSFNVNAVEYFLIITINKIKNIIFLLNSISKFKIDLNCATTKIVMFSRWMFMSKCRRYILSQFLLNNYLMRSSSSWLVTFWRLDWSRGKHIHYYTYVNRGGLNASEGIQETYTIAMLQSAFRMYFLILY